MDNESRRLYTAIRKAIGSTLRSNGFAPRRNRFLREVGSVCHIVELGKGTWDTVVQVTVGVCLQGCGLEQLPNLHICADAQALTGEDKVAWREALSLQPGMSEDVRARTIEDILGKHVLPWLAEFTSIPVIRERFADCQGFNQRVGLLTLEGRRILGLSETRA